MRIIGGAELACKYEYKKECMQLVIRVKISIMIPINRKKYNIKVEKCVIRMC